MGRDFTDRIKKKQEEPAGPPEKRASDIFSQPQPKKEAVHRTTLNLPMSVYQELRREAFDSETSMTDLLVKAWRARYNNL